MKITVDLSKSKNKDEVLYQFGDAFEIGGPKANMSIANGKGWGFNWDALADCLYHLDDGGIIGTSKKFKFPLQVQVIGSHVFEDNDFENFKIMNQILESAQNVYAAKGKQLKIIFK